MFSIIALIALGVLLLGVEVFLPGLIVGACGLLALGGAAALTYSRFGTTAGHALVFCLLLAGGGFFLWWLRYIPRSWIGRRWTLHETVAGKAEAPNAALHDAAGQAVTALRPAGIARLAGRRVDVVTEGDLVEAGAAVRVVRVEGSRVVVRQEGA